MDTSNANQTGYWSEGLPTKGGWYAFWGKDDRSPWLLRLEEVELGMVLERSLGGYFDISARVGLWLEIPEPAQYREAVDR